jgi:hypothetical protein
MSNAIDFIIHFNIVVPSIPQTFKFSGSSDSVTKILMHFSTLHYPSHAFLFDHPFSNVWYRPQIKKIHCTVFSIVLTLSFYLLPNISHITLFLGNLNLCHSLNVADQVPQKSKKYSFDYF